MSLKGGVWDHRRMILRLDFERMRTLDDVRAFMDGNTPVGFRSVDRDAGCELIRRMLVRFGYAGPVAPRSRLGAGGGQYMPARRFA